MGTKLDTPERIRAFIDDIFASDVGDNFYFFLCDGDRQSVMASPIDDVPPAPSADECTTMVRVFAQPTADFGGHLMLVISRRQRSDVTDSDRRWYEAMRTVCAEVGAGMLGVWLVTLSQVRELAPDDLTA